MRQPARLAVDVAQPRRRRDDAFQSVCHDASMFEPARMTLSILIVEST